MPYLSCKKIENDVYNFPTWQYCKYKDIFDSRIIINSTAKFYISISYQKDLLSIDTRIFTLSYREIKTVKISELRNPEINPGTALLVVGKQQSCIFPIDREKAVLYVVDSDVFSVFWSRIVHIVELL